MTEILHPDSQAPNGVKSHFIEIFLEELTKVGAHEVGDRRQGEGSGQAAWVPEAQELSPRSVPAADGGPEPQAHWALLHGRRQDSGVSAVPSCSPLLFC